MFNITLTLVPVAIWLQFTASRHKVSNFIFMHPRHLGMHIAIDCKLLMMSRIFLCADMFPYEDSDIVSVCPFVYPYPEKLNHFCFVNITPTVVNDARRKGVHQYNSMETQKYNFLKKKS